MEKFKNKLRDTFVTIKSKELNYINQTDSMNLLYFLKSYYPPYNNIMIPKKIFYTKIEDTAYIMSNINIIGYKLENNIYLNTEHTINIKFIPIKNELFIGRYTLFGINGNYYIEKDSNDIIKIPDPNPIIISEKINTNKYIKSILKSDMTHSVTDVLDLIPDIIHLSSNIEDDSVNITTESEQNNTYRNKKTKNNTR